MGEARTDLRTLASDVQKGIGVKRNLTIVLAALIVPGGLLALIAGFLVNRFANTEKGRKVVAVARARAPSWASALGTAALPSDREAA